MKRGIRGVLIPYVVPRRMYERFEERYERSVGSFYLPVALWLVGGGPGFVGS